MDRSCYSLRSFQRTFCDFRAYCRLVIKLEWRKFAERSTLVKRWGVKLYFWKKILQRLKISTLELPKNRSAVLNRKASVIFDLYLLYIYIFIYFIYIYFHICLRCTLDWTNSLKECNQVSGSSGSMCLRLAKFSIYARIFLDVQYPCGFVVNALLP